MQRPIWAPAVLPGKDRYRFAAELLSHWRDRGDRARYDAHKKARLRQPGFSIRSNQVLALSAPA